MSTSEPLLECAWCKAKGHPHAFPLSLWERVGLVLNCPYAGHAMVLEGS